MFTIRTTIFATVVESKSSKIVFFGGEIESTVPKYRRMKLLLKVAST